VSRVYEPGEHNLAAVHEAIAAAVPDRECIVFRDRRLTYAQVTARTRQLAHVLAGHGLGARPEGRAGLAGHQSHQDHVAIYAHNGNEYLEAMIGAFKARVVPVNINYRYVAEELRHILADSGSRGIIYHSAFAPRLAEVLPDLPELRVLLQVADDSGNGLLPGAAWYEETLAAAPTNLPDWADDWAPDDLYILYTGGTTGLPKGVLWRQADIFRTCMGGRMPDTREPWPSLDAIARAATASTPMIILPAAPFMHGAGHWIAFMALNQGSTVVIQDRVDHLDGDDIARVIERERVGFLLIVGDAFGRPIADAIASGRHDVSSLAILLSGGAPLSVGLKRRFFELLPDLVILDGLGSSEGGGQGMQTTLRGQEVSSGLFDPNEGSAVVADDLSAVLAPGHEGVGWMAKRGTDIPLGYLGDAAKTARTFPVIAGERMSVPGDRARWLPDGTVHLLGRDSVTINSGGEKIFAEEVEAAVLAHPAVADVVVAGRPSEYWGQEVVAIVQLRDGAAATVADLAAEAGRHVARYKLPKAWVLVDQVERSPAGKADYRWAATVAEKGA
jgi:fatty-acyl-CoA synthase